MEITHEEIRTNGYSQYTKLKSVAKPDIVLSIEKLNLDQTITSRAIQTYYNLQNLPDRATASKINFKKSRKQRRIFLCVFLAFIEVDHPRDPVWVAQLVNLDSGDVQQALNECPVAIRLDHVKLGLFYIEQLNKIFPDCQIPINQVETNIREIFNLCNEAPNGTELINSSSAKYIAVGIVYFYLTDLLGLRYTRENCESVFYLSWACIYKHYQLIVQLYNTLN